MTLAIITTIAGLIGIVLGRYFTVLSLAPPFVVLLITAIYFAVSDGWLNGLLTFFVPGFALQVGYLGSMIVHGYLKADEAERSDGSDHPDSTTLAHPALSGLFGWVR